MSRDQKIEQLNAQLNDTDCDTTPYTQKISELNQQVAALETENRTLEQKKRGLEAQLASRAEKPLASPPPANDGMKPLTPGQSGGSDNVDMQKLKIASTTASSRWGNHPMYDPVNMFDNKLNTSWISASGKITGQAVNAVLAEESTVHRLYVTIPEFNNGRPPQTLTLYFSDGSSQRIAMQDKFGKQRFTIQPKKTKKIEVELGEMFGVPPKTNPHFEIAELEFYGAN